MPRLNLLADDRLHLSVIFAPVLDERLDRGIEVVGQFTAVEDIISRPVYTLRTMIGIT